MAGQALPKERDDASALADDDASPTPHFTPYATEHEDGWQLYMQVEGIHCARCIHAIESTLDGIDDVTFARVNMSTKRLLVRWKGEQALAETLAQKVAALNYPVSPFHQNRDGESSAEDKKLLRCMAVAGFGMGNIMLLSVALWSSSQEIMGLATRDAFHWLSALIAIPTIAYAGRPFFQSAIAALRAGKTNMDVPISLALLLATGMSLHETAYSGEHAYFDSAVMLLFFLLIGRWLDARARGKASESAETLLQQLHGTATVIQADGSRKTIRIDELREGMEVFIATGEKIPTDIEITDGESQLDTSLVTGESAPRDVAVGDTAFGGTINLAAPLRGTVLKASEDSLLADIVRLMEQAEQGRANYVRLADKAARLYTPVVHSLALCAFLGWYVIGGVEWQQALLIAITTLIITCPCALALAVPVVQVLASSWLMKRGILIKSGDALERLSRMDTLVLDKTGTLTESDLTLRESNADKASLAIALALAERSHHPLAKALCAASNSPASNEVSDIKEESAMGMHGTYKGQAVRLGRASWCGAESNHEDGYAELWLKIGDAPATRFAFGDTMRADAADVIRSFKGKGVQSTILSGDREAAVIRLAEQVGIDTAKAALMPAKKADYIQQLRDAGKHVAMIGDGLNDAPALRQADVSLSPSSGMDITQNSADMVFQGKLLAPVWMAWNMARYSTHLVKQNFALAILYNMIAIPIALAGYVTPLIAAIAMSGSSLLVVANALRINTNHSWGN